MKPDISKDSFFTIASEGRTEIIVKRSRFIASARRCVSEDEAKNCLKMIESEFPSANHNCWAARYGVNRFTEHYSDDGEPGGSAGRPIMSSLLRRNMTNLIVIVTRYFGGIKLGVRGLIDAYAEASGKILDECGSRMMSNGLRYNIIMPYNARKNVLNAMLNIGAENNSISESFGEFISMSVSVPLSAKTEAEDALLDMARLFHGISWSILKETLIVIDDF